MKNVSAAEMAKGNGQAYSPNETIADLIDLCEDKGFEKQLRINRINGVWRQELSVINGSGEALKIVGTINKLGYWTNVSTRNGQPTTTHKLFRYLGVWR